MSLVFSHWLLDPKDPSLIRFVLYSWISAFSSIRWLASPSSEVFGRQWWRLTVANSSVRTGWRGHFNRLLLSLESHRGDHFFPLYAGCFYPFNLVSPWSLLDLEWLLLAYLGELLGWHRAFQLSQPPLEPPHYIGNSGFLVSAYHLRAVWIVCWFNMTNIWLHYYRL